MSDEIVIVDGIAVTSVARTVVDIARTVPFEQAVVVLDAALARGLVDGLAARGGAVARPSGGAAPRLRGGRSRSPSRAPQSVGESRSRVAIMRAGLPRPVLQWEVRDGSGPPHRPHRLRLA